MNRRVEIREKTVEELNAMPMNELIQEHDRILSVWSEAEGRYVGIEDALDELRDCDEYTAQQTGKLIAIKRDAWRDVLAASNYAARVSKVRSDRTPDPLEKLGEFLANYPIEKEA